MASPFKFFRKYSGGMMVVMVILSMLLFTLTDLFMDPSANLWLLGILVGGAVFGVAGIGQGRWLQWGLGGAVLGAALGFILPGFVEGEGLTSSLGVIDQEEMNDLENRRSVANQFVVRVTEATFGEGAGRFASLFGFGHQSMREDVIFGKLLRAEADRLGITVDKDMVGDYLNRITSDKLTRDDYITVRNNLGYRNLPLDDSTLISILSDEIKARMVYQLLRPRTTTLPPGPEVYWQYFRRLNVRQQLNLAALDVDDFTDQVGEPSDADVNELFAQYAKKFPNQEEPGAPGFRLPFRAQLAYVELDSKTVESDVGEISEADIEEYYNQNKETPLIRRPVIPDFDDKPEDPAPEAEKPEETKPTPEKSDAETSDSDAAVPEAAGSDKPAEAKPAEDKPAEDKPADDKPADDKPATEKGATETPAEEKPAGDDKPAETPKEEQPATDDSEAAAPNDDADGESDSAAPDDSCGVFESDEDSADNASADDEEKEVPPADEKPANEKPAEVTQADAASAKAADPAATDEAKTDEPKTDEAAAGDSTPEKDESADAPAPPTLTIPQVPDTAVPAEGAQEKPPEPQFEYRVLDDELKAEIRDEIRRQRVDAIIQEKMDKAEAQMATLANERSKEHFNRLQQDPSRFEAGGDKQEEALRQLRAEMAPYNDELNARLSMYAKEQGLSYVETPLVSYAELLEEEDYPVGTAAEPTDNPMMAAQAANVALTIFQSFSADEQNNDAQLYLVRRAERQSGSMDGGQVYYAYWAIDFSPSHIPELDEPGIRDLVVLTWKRLKARELVVKRGEELAARIRTALAKEGEEKQDMAAVLKDETVTGSADAPALAVRTTLPFSWLRTSTASPMSFQPPQATMSQIVFGDTIGGTLDKVGEDFMKAVFEDMDDESVDVVPNGDRSKYYVVHVTNRFPTPEIGEDGLRERFANEGKQFAFAQSPITGVMQQQLNGPASLAWERGLWLRYGINPDDEPEAE
ncbi:MAG: hypothetical protein RIK87_23945 [Fuerstiella sp.]